MTGSPHALRLVRPASRTSRGTVREPWWRWTGHFGAVVATDPAVLVLGAPGTGKTTSRSRRWSPRSRADCPRRTCWSSGRAGVRRLTCGTGSPRGCAGRRAGRSCRPRPRRRSRCSGPARPCWVTRSRRWSPAPSRTSSSVTCSPGTPRVTASCSPGRRRSGPDVLGLRPFRDELRDLLMRAAERGLIPVDLAALAAAHHRPAWASAAPRLYAEYLDVDRLRAGTPDLGARLDPAVVVDEAAQACAPGTTRCPAPARPRWRLVVVDDYQESDVGDGTAAAGARRRRRARWSCWRILGRGRADVPRRDAVAGRAGGVPRPELGRARRPHHRAAHRVAARRRAAVGGRSGRGPRWSVPVGAVQHRPAWSRPGPGEDVRVAVLPSTAQEAASRRARACAARTSNDGLEWSQMAVVARSGAQVTALRRALTRASVPVSVLGSDVPLREEPAARPLLDAMRRALRRRRAARRHRRGAVGVLPAGRTRHRRPAPGPAGCCARREQAPGGGRTSDALLVEASRSRARVDRRPWRTSGGAARPRARGRSTAPRPSRVPTRRPSCGRCGTRPGRPSRGAGRLSPGVPRGSGPTATSTPSSPCSARRDVRGPNAARAPGAFLDWLQAQDLPSDSLAAHGSRRPPCRCSRRAGAAGREWDLVVVAGVQEGRGRTCGCGTRSSARRRWSTSSAVARCPARPTTRTAAPRGTRSWPTSCASFAVACSRARRAPAGDGRATTSTSSRPPLLDLVEPVRRRGRDPAARTCPRRSTCAGWSRGAARAPRAGRGRRRGARPRGRAHARAAGGGTTCRARTRRTGTASREPSVRGTPVGRGPPRPGLPVQGRDRAAVRPAVGAWRPPGGTTSRRAAARTSARCSTRSRRSTRRARRRSSRRRSTAGGPSSGSAPAGRRWPRGARRTRWSHRLAVYLRNAGPPLLVEGAFAVDTDRACCCGGRSTGSSGSRTRPRGRSCGSSTSRRGRSPSQREQGRRDPQLGAYQAAVDAGAFDGLPDGTTSGGASSCSSARVPTAATRSQEPLGRPRPTDPGRGLMVDQVADKVARVHVPGDRERPVRTAARPALVPGPWREGGQVVA